MTERERVIVRREPLLDKVCLVCGKAFVGLTRQKHCSRQCANRASYQRYIDKRRAERRERYRRQKAAELGQPNALSRASA